MIAITFGGQLAKLPIIVLKAEVLLALTVLLWLDE
jgi:hypothetical protein